MAVKASLEIRRKKSLSALELEALKIHGLVLELMFKDDSYTLGATVKKVSPFQTHTGADAMQVVCETSIPKKIQNGSSMRTELSFVKVAGKWTMTDYSCDNVGYHKTKKSGFGHWKFDLFMSHGQLFIQQYGNQTRYISGSCLGDRRTFDSHNEWIDFAKTC